MDVNTLRENLNNKRPDLTLTVRRAPGIYEEVVQLRAIPLHPLAVKVGFDVETIIWVESRVANDVLARPTKYGYSSARVSDRPATSVLVLE